MKKILTLLILIKFATQEDLKDMNVENLIHLAEDVSQIRPDDVSKSDILLFLSDQNTSKLKISNETDIDPSKPTKIIIHGWLENHKRSWYKEITAEYLINGDFNVIQVDWERVARSSYISSAMNTKLVGNYLGEFILNRKLPLEEIHIIGHSLGAHIAAFAAKKIKSESGSKIFRITGLDPAGPYFREFFITKNDRLNENDAQIVDVIHTDGGFYGYENHMGTLDVYVNGGIREQPGCLENMKVAPIGEAIENSFCSHARSVRYFIESINKGKFVCKKCVSWISFVLEQCRFSETYEFYAEDLTVNMVGKCFVKTNSKAPFLN